MIVQTDKEKETLREGGARLATIMEKVTARVVPGVSTDALNSLALEEVQRAGGEAAFLGYQPKGAPRPFPAALCTSVNDEVVHGIPNEKPHVLQEGDIVTLDMGLRYKGIVTDMAMTVPVGEIDNESRRLVEAAREALTMALAIARPGQATGDIGAVVSATAGRYGFSVPSELGGHGVGKAVHEEPFVPNVGEPGSGTKITEGMVLAIEPIVIAGKGEIFCEDDGYTYKTRDGSRVAQFEHTVLVTKDGAEILTKK